MWCLVIRDHMGVSQNWVNCNNLTATSLEQWLIEGIIPTLALFQVNEL